MCVCMLSRFSHIQLSATPWTVTLPSPLSMEFSRQEYWSGSPCLSPEDLPNPGIEPRSPSLQADSLPAESPGKPKNTGMSSLSLFQWIFPTQESHQDFLHCRWVLYQLSYEGNQICQNDHVNIPPGELIWTMIFTILLYSRFLSGNLPHDLSYLMDPRKSHWFPVHSPFIS